MDELKLVFIEEAEDLFESINDILYALEERDITDDELNALFRDFHTLKGGSGSVGFEKFVKLVHVLENFLDKLRNHEISYRPEMTDFLIDTTEELELVLKEEANGELDDAKVETMLQNITSSIEGFLSGDGGSSTDSSQSESSDTSDTSDDEHDDEHVVNIGIDGGEEIIDILDKLKDMLDANHLPVDETFRLVHTLKAAAMMLNLRCFTSFIHNVENVLVQMRDGGIEDDEIVHDLIERFLKHSETILDNDINGERDDSRMIIEELSQDIEKYKEKIQEAQGFVLFDDEPQKQESNTEEQGFVLFDDDDIAQSQKSQSNKPKQEEKKEKPKQEEKKQEEKKQEEKKEKPKQPAKQEEKKQEEKTNEPKKETKPTTQSKPSQKTPAKNNSKKQKSFKDLIASSSIRVNLEKIETLMNRVGDLVITKSMLYEFANSFEDYSIRSDLYEKLDVLDRNVRELQDAVMSVRMVAMESIYSKLPKVIRDISKKLNKKVIFEHYGDNVEIDKLMSESLMDPLTHILRNALDHGIEPPEERIKAGKPKEGKIIIRALQESGQIILEIQDDGRGIDAERVAQKALENGVITQEQYERMSFEDKVMLIFSAGLSTADKVSDISGRGVGMDVVMNNIHSIGGTIKVKTEIGKGTTFIIAIPLTLAILDGLNIKIGKFNFIIPLNMVVESFQPVESIIKHIVETGDEILMLRDEFVPVIKLYKFFSIEPRCKDLTKGIIIISVVGSKKVALFIDEFSTQEQIVVKSLDKNYQKVKGISAATIRGDGSVGLILDVPDIVGESR
ncbi:MAG: chemotaxis protein CheA [Epsilonproteobacteria bacterium]|nr:chemotaxis protein CheA [Campylobacterota bacterium]